jgi:ABC-2 type transport system permease protein
VAAASPPLEARVVGPSAVGGDWRRVLHLSTTLAVTELKVRFFDSVLGYLWSLVRPLLFFGVLYAVFNTIVRAGSGIDFYPAVLLTGIVLYTFVAEATTDAVESVMKHESLVRRVAFPRLVIPLSVTMTAAFNLGMNLVAALFFMLVSGVRPHWTWLELPLLLAVITLFALGVAMLLSVLYVRFRDVKPIWQVAMQALFYATPILYPIEAIQKHAPRLAELALFNPLAAVNQQVRHAVIDPSAPSAAAAIGGGARLLVPAAIVAGVFGLGLWVFSRMAPHIAEEL